MLCKYHSPKFSAHLFYTVWLQLSAHLIGKNSFFQRNKWPHKIGEVSNMHLIAGEELWIFSSLFPVFSLSLLFTELIWTKSQELFLVILSFTTHIHLLSISVSFFLQDTSNSTTSHNPYSYLSWIKHLSWTSHLDHSLSPYWSNCLYSTLIIQQLSFFLVSWPLHVLKNYWGLEELLFMWIITIDIYCVRIKTEKHF